MSIKTRCRDLDVVLSAYVDHEATADEMAHVEAHTRMCPACAARLGRYQALTPRLEADMQALLFKSESAAPLTTRARFRPPRERMTPETPPLFGRLSTVALALAVAVLVGVVLVRSAPAGRTPGLDTGGQPAAPTGASPLDPVQVIRAPLLVASIDGLMDPAVAAYVHRTVAIAEDAHAGALVLVLNASGELDGAKQQVAQDLATSSVPVLIFTPQASAPNLDTFLRAVDGTEARTPAGSVMLATTGARIDTVEMEPLEAIAHRLMDPTTAYLLFVLGLYAVFVELAHPGSMLPGMTGAICLALASIAFAMLPTNWLGVLVLIAAVGLMALELKAATHGALVLAGVVCLMVGSVLLYAAPGSLVPMQADVTVAPAVLVGAAVTGLIVGLLLARIGRRIHNLPPLLNLEQLISARGVTRGGLDPDGVVHVGGQLWSARVRGGRLEPGQPVRVVARDGLVLEVESAALGAATRKGTVS